MALLAYSLKEGAERTIESFSLDTLICKLTASLKLVVNLVFGKVPEWPGGPFGGHFGAIRGRVRGMAGRAPFLPARHGSCASHLGAGWSLVARAAAAESELAPEKVGEARFRNSSPAAANPSHALVRGPQACTRRARLPNSVHASCLGARRPMAASAAAAGS